MYWLMLMMSEFFESVNAYRDAMRAHVHAELGLPALPAGTAALLRPKGV